MRQRSQQLIGATNKSILDQEYGRLTKTAVIGNTELGASIPRDFTFAFQCKMNNSP